MVNRRRPREPTRPNRPITRSITQLAEERAKQKPRLSAFGQEHKPNMHRNDTYEVSLPHTSCGLSLSARTSTMAFSYPRFNGETDTATHVRMFMNVWNANHMAQRLPEEEAYQSKMTKFGLTLDGKTAFWHSHGICQQSKLSTNFNRTFYDSFTGKSRNM